MSSALFSSVFFFLFAFQKVAFMFSLHMYNPLQPPPAGTLLSAAELNSDAIHGDGGGGQVRAADPMHLPSSHDQPAPTSARLSVVGPLSGQQKNSNTGVLDTAASSEDGASGPPLVSFPVRSSQIETVCERLRDGVEFTRVLRAAVRRCTDLNPMDSVSLDGLCGAIEQLFHGSIGILSGATGAPLDSPRAHHQLGDALLESSNMTSGSRMSQPRRPSGVLTPTLLTYDHVSQDVTVTQWLNENFAKESRKKRPGYDSSRRRSKAIVTDATAPSSARLVPAGPDTPSTLSTEAPPPATPPADVVPCGASLDAPAPKEFPSVVGMHTVVFTRKSERDVPAARNYADVAVALKRCGVPMIVDVDGADFDIFACHDKYGPETLVNVAMNIFCRYSLVSTLGLDLLRLKRYLQTLRQCYRDENPYHNQLHAADVMQTAHVFLLVNDMRENLSDVELLAVLFAAVIHDVGHLGISNAFLVKIRHPLARLANDLSTLEAAHAAAGLFLLEQEGCNFFRSIDEMQLDCLSGSDECFCPLVTRDMYDDFRQLVISCVLGTDMRVHAEHGSVIRGLLSDNVIDDTEIAMLLRSIVHVADIANPMKPYATYKRWVECVLQEFWMQGDEEVRRGLPLSMLCDRRTTVVGKPQSGFINFVVRPFVDEMSSIMPALWMERLNDNAVRMASMTQEEEAAMIASIGEEIGNRAWTDVDANNSTSLVSILRRICDTHSDAVNRTNVPPELFQPIPAPPIAPAALKSTEALNGESAGRSSLVPSPPHTARRLTPVAASAEYNRQCSTSLQHMSTPQWILQLSPRGKVAASMK